MKINSMLPVVLLGAACLLAPASVAAQPPEATRAEALAPIVVVGTRHPRLATDVVGTVSAIAQEELEQRMVFDLEDLVREEPGVAIDGGDTRFGAGGFRIRGIGGNRVTTLVDGVPVPDSFTVGAFADSGRDYIDMGLVRRVEILRGPASTLYGSRALGGVVAIETLQPRDLTRGGDEPATGYGLSLGYRGDRDGLHAGTRAAYTDDRNGMLLAFGARRASEREPARIPDRSRMDRQDLRSHSVLAKHVAELANDSRVQLTLDAEQRRRDTDIRSFIGLPGRYANTTELVGDDEQDAWRVGVQHELFVGEATRVAWRTFGYSAEVVQSTHETRAGIGVRFDRRFEYRQDGIGLGADVQHDMPLGRWSHLIGFGAEVQSGKLQQRRDALQTDLESGAQSSENVLGEDFPLRDFPITRTFDAGLYLHNEISREGSRLTVIPGVRYDFSRLDSRRDIIFESGTPEAEIVDLDDGRWTGNLGLRWQAGPGWSLYAQLAQGFRAPPSTDVNLALALETPAGPARSLPNPDLRPERSQGVEVGSQLVRGGSRFSVAAFDNRYRDFIQSRALINVYPDGLREFQSINIDRARIYGLELRYRQQLGSWTTVLDAWSVELAAEWLRGENRLSGEPLNDVGPPRGVLVLGWDPAGTSWGLRSTSTFVRRQDRVDESRGALYQPSGYAVHDLMGEYRIAEGWAVRAGVFNIFDRHYHDWNVVSGRAPTDPVLPWLAGSGRHVGAMLQGRF
jgi:hemoglobin/transferrin/lactoferrin receptor protein